MDEEQFTMEDYQDDDFEIDYFICADQQRGDSKISRNKFEWLQAFQAASHQFEQNLANCAQFQIQRMTDQLEPQDLSSLINSLKKQLQQRSHKQNRQKQIKGINSQNKYQTPLNLKQSRQSIISYPSFPSPIFHSQHYEQKRKAAEIFIGQEYFPLSQQNSISDLHKEIMIESYSTLQTFMQRYLKKSTMQLKQQDRKYLQFILYNCRDNLFEADCQTYFKFVKITYSIAQIPLTTRQTSNLYLALQEWILAYRLTNKQSQHNNVIQNIGRQTISQGSSIVRNTNNASIIKGKPYDKKDREQFRTFVNQRHVQVDILSQYKLNPTISHITAQLKHKYSDKQHLITLIQVKTKFHMILRAAYRRLLQLWDMLDCQSQMPRLLPINNHYIQTILLSASALKVRMALIDIWLLEVSDSNQVMRRTVTAAVRQINQYMCCSQQDQVKYDKQKQFDEINRLRKAKAKRKSSIKKARGISSTLLIQTSDQL